jgi:hypothetical protein
MKGNEGTHATFCTLQNKKRHESENIEEKVKLNIEQYTIYLVQLLVKAFSKYQ